MKTPKITKQKETTLGKSAGGMITKNKAKGKNHPGSQVDAAKAKLGLQKGKDTVKVQDAKNLKKSDMKSKVFNGKGSPLNGSGGKKRKSDEGGKPAVKKSKGAAASKSPEVRLGLKIEKLLESPKNAQKNRKRGKKNAAKTTVATPEVLVETPVAGSPGKKRNRRKRDKKRNDSEGSSPVAAKPAGNQQKKIKRPAAPKPLVDKPEWDAPVPLGSFPSRINAENAIKAILKHMKEHKAKKPAALLDDYEPLMVSVDFFKKPENARKLQRVLLPHQMLGNNPDIIFVVTDDKKAKKDHDESIEKHKELFKSSGVDNITEIIPWRKLCHEYTQFEEKRKLANRADAFLIDSRLSHRWPAIMRKKFFQKKAPIPVRTFKPNDLKNNIEVALRKVAIILGGNNTLSVCPQFGNSKMSVKSLADNLITVVTVLCDQTKYPGGQGNIRQITVRGGKTEGFPVFVSTVSPNTVDVPKITKKKRAVVEGEVTTAGVTVRVHPSGNVQIKSRDEDDEEEGNTSPKKKAVNNEEDSDEDDSEIDEDDSDIDADLLDKFKKANQASEDESSEDEEEIEKAEQEFLSALRNQQAALEAEALARNKKAGKKAPVVKEDSSDEDDEDLDDEDESDVPDLIPAKKSKPQTQPAKKGKNAKQAPGGAKPAQNGVGKGKPGKGKPGKQAQSPKGAGPKKGFQGGKGKANQKGNNKGSPKAQQKFNKGGKKK